MGLKTVQELWHYVVPFNFMYLLNYCTVCSPPFITMASPGRVLFLARSRWRSRLRCPPKCWTTARRRWTPKAEIAPLNMWILIKKTTRWRREREFFYFLLPSAEPLLRAKNTTLNPNFVQLRIAVSGRAVCIFFPFYAILITWVQFILWMHKSAATKFCAFAPDILSLIFVIISIHI